MHLSITVLLLLASSCTGLSPSGTPSTRPELRLRGGVGFGWRRQPHEPPSSTAEPSEAVVEPAIAPPVGGRRTLYIVCLASVFAWLSLSSLAYARSEGWPLTQSIFYSVDVGMGIGFGAFEEKFARSKAFSCVHMLVCASGVAGALGLFTEAWIADAANVAASEYGGPNLRAPRRSAAELPTHTRIGLRARAP